MDYGKSLCILCKKPLAEAVLVAHPSDCPTHHFHCECLVKHARQSRLCPIDRIPFETVICDSDLPIAFSKCTTLGPDLQPQEAKEGKESRPVRKQESPRKSTPDLSQGMTSVDEEKKFENKNDLPISRTVTRGSDLQPTDFLCSLCGSGRDAVRASPDCCGHFFHELCLHDYLRCHSICPIEGCHREVTTYSNQFGKGSQLEMTVECEYRNLSSAPEGFTCDVCGNADLGWHRAKAHPCGHECHRQCLTDYVRSHRKCPVCQNPTKIVNCNSSGRLWFP